MAALSKVYWRETWKLRAFGLLKIPLLLFCMPKVVEYSDTAAAVMIPLNWRTRNHLGSMYFGALSVGADCAGGLIAMFEIMRRKAPVSLIFKEFKAEFLKRPMADVVFRCVQGEEVRGWVDKAISGDERINGTVNLIATCPSLSAEPVAKFALTISLKRKDAKKSVADGAAASAVQ